MPPLEIALFDDLGRALSMTGVLVGLGILMATSSPTTFGIEMGAIGGAAHARRRVLLIAGAVALSSTLLALVFLVINPTALHALWTGKLEPIVEQHWVDAFAGLVLVLVGLWQWHRAARPPRPKRDQSRLDRSGALFAFVAAESLVSATGPPTMYLVVHTLSTIRTAVLWPFAYAAFLIGLVAPFVVLGVAATRIPVAARWLSRLANAVAERDLRRPIAVIVIAAGAVLCTISIVQVVHAG